MFIWKGGKKSARKSKRGLFPRLEEREKRKAPDILFMYDFVLYGRTSTWDVDIKKVVRFGVLAIHVFGNQVKKVLTDLCVWKESERKKARRESLERNQRER